MGLFTPKSYTTELSPKSLKEVGDETTELQHTVAEDVVPFTGATVSENGKEGLVPAPTSDDKGKFLKGDGTWGTPSGGGGGGTSDYEDLTNKPAIDNVTLSKDTTSEDLGLAKKSDIPDVSDLAKKSEIPSKVSELQNDSGFISGFTETDPTVPSWAKAGNKPSYTKSEVGLGNVDNTSDANKPVSTATAAALALKQDVLTAGDGIQISGQNVISINPTFGFTPVGTVISVMGNSAPANYLECNGQVVNIADYPELANYFLNEFGSKNYFGGDGTTTFGIPDLRGEFLRGTGTNSHSGQGNGSAVGVHQNATEFLNWFYNNYKNLCVTYNKYVSNVDSSVDSDWCYYESRDLNVSDNTKLGKFTSRPTNTSVLYCIATKNIYLNPSNDYSTDEKVVGTWIDGKPIYQKTIPFIGVTNKNWNHNIDSIDNIVDIKGTIRTTTGTTDVIPESFPSSGATPYYARIQITNDKVYISTNFTGTDWENGSGIITIQYTKTTD